LTNFLVNLSNGLISKFTKKAQYSIIYIMTPPEFSLASERQITSEFVGTLKLVAAQFRVPVLEWKSSDDFYRYTAEPLELEGEASRGLDIAKIGNMSIMDASEVFNAWEVSRIHKVAEEDDDVRVDRFMLMAWLPMTVTTAVIPATVEDPEKLDESVGKKLDKELENGGLVRLIPYSIEPWPEDMDAMTPAQAKAMAKLRR
jgi:hypothetical protein